MSSSSQAGGPSNGRAGILDMVERVGNALPDPAILFFLGAVLVMALSHVGELGGWTVTPKIPQQITASDGSTALELIEKPDSEPIGAKSLLTSDGFYWAIRTMVPNFIGFAPLGIVLTGMLGIGVAEKTGMLGAALKAFMLVVPNKLLTPAMVLVGIMSSLATDAGYVVLPPLAAALYLSVGRSPLAGIAAVFAGVAAGFNANLLVTGLDPLLASLSTIAAQTVDADYTVAATSNWLFMIASVFVITLVGWATSSWIVEKRLSTHAPEDGGPPAGAGAGHDVASQRLTKVETRGLLIALAAELVFVGLLLAAVLIPGGPLHGHGFVDGVPGKVPLKDNFDRWIEAIVPLLFFAFLIPGLAYGLATGSLKSSRQIAQSFVQTMADMAPIVVLAFFAAQFIEYFKYSQLDQMLAMAGGQFLFGLGLPGWSLMAAFILLTAVFNLFVGSMSAKYTMFAPIFIPMFMLVGISPELTQVAYRIGDSVSNIITPLNAYLVIILVFMQKHAPRAGMGTLISMMLPYTLVFGVVWTVMLILWMNLGAPLGLPPESGPLTYPPPP